MTAPLHEARWTRDRLHEAVVRCAQEAGLAPAGAEARAQPAPSGDALLAWVDAVGAQVGVECESLSAPYTRVDGLVRTLGPSIVRLGDDTFLVVLKCGARDATLLAPDGSRRRIGHEAIRDAMCAEAEAPLRKGVGALVEAGAVAPARRDRARRAVLEAYLAEREIGGVWTLRLGPDAPPLRQLRDRRLLRHVAVFAVAYAAQYALWIVSWWLIGRAALTGRVEPGWLLGWALALVAMVPLRMLANWSQGLFFIGAGAALKQRLLSGAARLDPDEARLLGAGQTLGRVIESESVERLALAGGFQTVASALELLGAVAVVAAGAGGPVLAMALVVWTLVALAIVRVYADRLGAWTDGRLGLTHDLVERMVGHRTRLVQERPDRWHDDEDAALARYKAVSRRLDRLAACAFPVIPQVWLALAVLALIPAVLAGATPTAMAIGVGGALLASQSLSRLVGGLASLVGAGVAWRRVRSLYKAGSVGDEPGDPASVVALDSDAPGAAVIDARSLAFAYRSRDRRVLDDCSLTIRAGDRVLLEGPSGGGKSTLAALLAGLRSPDAGLLLLRGLDRATLGDAWRRRVGAAPQFHENHILTASLGLNLLLGRAWPPSGRDLAEAEEICSELGLGPLLDRMPSRLNQMVGDAGWQLSHGERSRVYLARALLHAKDFLILDESFASLDPETLRQCVSCVVRRAPALVVIAHP